MSEFGPGRTALVRENDALQAALAEYEAAKEPITALDRIRASATVGEAEQLREEIRRLRDEHNDATAQWIESGCVGDRIALPAELVDLEQRLGAIAKAAVEAAPRLRAAQTNLAEANDRVRVATEQRNTAIPAAAEEAVESEIAALADAIAGVVRRHARVLGIIHVLRAAGRQAADPAPYLGAAERIQNRLRGLRASEPAPDLAPGRRLLRALLVNPAAEF